MRMAVLKLLLNVLPQNKSSLEFVALSPSPQIFPHSISLPGAVNKPGRDSSRDGIRGQDLTRSGEVEMFRE